MGQHIQHAKPHHRFPRAARLWHVVALVALTGVGMASAETPADTTSVPAASAQPANVWDDVTSWWGDDEEDPTDTNDGTSNESDDDWWWGTDEETDGETDGWPTDGETTEEWATEEGGTGDSSDPDEEWHEGEWTEGTDETEPVEVDLSQPTGDEPLGYICYRDGREKPITPADALWLAKMVHGETGGTPSQADADAMLWTIASRTDLPSFRDKSVRHLTRNYSQPINKKWTRSGSKCREYYAEGFTGEIPDKCSKSRTRRRAKYIAMEWDDTAELARRSVLDFAAGRIPNPVVGAIGWFASGTWRKGEREGHNGNREWLAEIEKNTFYARRRGPATVDWDEWDVSVVPADQFCPDFVGDASAAEVSK